jgi:hypothetical protein
MTCRHYHLSVVHRGTQRAIDRVRTDTDQRRMLRESKAIQTIASIILPAVLSTKAVSSRLVAHDPLNERPGECIAEAVLGDGWMGGVYHSGVCPFGV